MSVKDIWDIFGGILLIALVAVILTKANTAKDIQTTGQAFTGALSTAEKG
jgi:predicted small secreted protein